MRLVCLLTVFALSGCGESSGDVGGQPASENPLGMLVECDQVIEEVIGYQPPDPEDVIVRRHKVAVLPVADPASVTIVRCDGYYSHSDGPREEWTGVSGANCFVSGSWVVDRGIAFTPNFEVYVECEEEELWPDGSNQTYGNERVYIRTKLAEAPLENPLGVAVECNEVIETTSERYFDGYGMLESVERRKVAYVPVDDPTRVTVTRCGEFHAFNGTTNVSRSECVAAMETESSLDSNVIVECGMETTYPVGWSYVNGGQGGVGETGHAYVYVRVDPSAPGDEPENPLGTLVECDEVLEWEFSPGTAHATLHRLSVAYVPVADPTSVTITRCGEYKITGDESTHSDACVSGEGASFTEDFEVYVKCEEERTGWLSGIKGYDRIYLRAD